MDKKQALLELILSSPSFAEESEGAEGTFKSYLSSLRAQREQFVAAMLDSQQKPTATRAELITAVKNIQNRTRGRLGELLGRVMLTQQTEATDTNLETDKVVFDTPFGQRRIDVYWADKKLAIETKMGYITYSRGIRAQIKKDAYLLQQKTIDSVVWVLIKGASSTVKQQLTQNGIAYKEGWPKST